MAGFTPVEEVERISMGPRDMVARVVRDFCREGWVGDQSITTPMMGLAEEVELGEEVEIIVQIPVGVVVDPTMLETISRMNVVTIRLAMVR